MPWRVPGTATTDEESAMRGIDNRHVVVGVDDALTCLPAVRAAARHAAARGATLYVVHAMTRHAPSAKTPCTDPTAAASAVALDEVPTLTVRAATVPGSAEFALLTAANGASLVVIGHRDHAVGRGRLTGSLGLRLAGRTSCPLLIARCEGNPDGPVVVGVDDPRVSDAVLIEAFRQARTLRRPVHVVHAWHARLPALAGPPAGYGHELSAMFEAEAVAAEVERIAIGFPDVAVSAEVLEGRERRTLLAAAVGAVLLVVGAHRDPGPAGLIAGTLAMTAAARASCPVLVVDAGGD
jgi:nucleotide-binding universal stress UspA family protein